MRVIIILTTVFAIISPSVAFAYLDPGTGGVLLQGLLAGTAGVLAVLKLYWQRIKSFFARLFSSRRRPDLTSKAKNNADPN